MCVCVCVRARARARPCNKLSSTDDSHPVGGTTRRPQLHELVTSLAFGRRWLSEIITSTAARHGQDEDKNTEKTSWQISWST